MWVLRVRVVGFIFGRFLFVVLRYEYVVAGVVC